MIMCPTVYWRRVLNTGVALAMLSIAAVSHADCKAVLDAMKKSADQPRVATYEVDNEKSPPIPGDGLVVIRIGNTSWTAPDGKHFTRNDNAGQDVSKFQSMFADLDRKGGMGCEQAGSGTYQGKHVVKYRYNNPTMTRNLPPELLKKFGAPPSSKMHKAIVFIDTATGLNVYGEAYTPLGMKVSTATVYGDAVKEPREKAGK
jgi:hypothetical protein